ncbi:MAG: SusD/RagB family nutrient-binding outer membrane lipoprotein [Bacteroidales bacterium]|nr:SusD/RagB family nutrient-binding outer membrane lipoprotein [Bacteroidales bacterium]
MKTINKFKVALLALVLVIIGSCTKNFDEMNVNPNAATVVPATNVFGRAIISVAGTLFGERLDVYYAGSYAGHTAHIGIGDYEYRVDINNSMWRGMYTSMTYFVDAMRLADGEGNTNLYAAALTLKAYSAQKTTDMWGKIPYSEAFRLEDNIIYPKYDSQKEVYHAILDELKTAADMFNSGTGNLGAGDFLFNGNLDKWKKFCNSTRLRVAIRISSVDEATANAVITEILNNPDTYPLLTDNSDNAYLWFPGVPPDQEFWYERMGAASGIKTDPYRTNYELIQALKDHNDPRLPVYADKNKYGIYNGYRFYNGQTMDTLNNGNNVSHIGDRFGNDPKGFSPFMNCAETYFILAEIYERGLASGDAQQAYETAIKRSLEENGIDEAATATFLAQSDVAWDSGTTSNLDKIYLQKWISLFKQSVEAWSENRRTDVPKITDVSENYALSHNRPPFRMAYADEEKSLNTNFPTDVVETDIFWGTQMWWDTRTDVH